MGLTCLCNILLSHSVVTISIGQYLATGHDIVNDNPFNKL